MDRQEEIDMLRSKVDNDIEIRGLRRSIRDNLAKLEGASLEETSDLCMEIQRAWCRIHFLSGAENVRVA